MSRLIRLAIYLGAYIGAAFLVDTKTLFAIMLIDVASFVYEGRSLNK